MLGFQNPSFTLIRDTAAVLFAAVDRICWKSSDGPHAVCWGEWKSWLSCPKLVRCFAAAVIDYGLGRCMSCLKSMADFNTIGLHSDLGCVWQFIGTLNLAIVFDVLLVHGVVIILAQAASR